MIRRHSTQLAVVSSLLMVTALSAQTAADNKSANSDDGEIVRLSEFNVSTSRDYGYRASNSIAGTRTDTPIRDIPMNIQVFTKDLADDLHITNTVDLEAYNAAMTNGGADRHSDNVIQQSYNNFIFRGFRQNWALRDGIREYDPVDTQNLARVEIVKGPAAALYGLSYPGGVQQNITKTADFNKNFTELRASYGSYGEYRGTIDANLNGSVGGHKVAIRVNGANSETHDEREHSKGYIRLEAVQLGLFLTPTTKIDGFFEQGKKQLPNGLGYFTRSDPNAPDSRADIPLQITHPEIPWDWNWSNGRNFRSLDTKLYRGTITQTIGDNFSINGYVQYSSRQQIDGNGWDANGSGGADAWESGGGWITTNGVDTIQSGYHYRDWSNNMHTYGATGVYKLDVASVKNTFAFGAAVWKEKFVSRAMADSNGTLLVYPLQADIPITIPSFPPPGLHPVVEGDNAYNHENNSNDYYFLNWQTSSLDNRLKTVIGVNKTNIKLVHWKDGVATAPDNVYSADKVSPLYGVTFDVTKDISIFALRATSLFPDSTKDSFGKQFSPQEGSSWEAGVKVDMFDGKISGTISAYQIEQKGGSQNDPNAININTVKWDADTPEQRAIDFPGQSVRPLGDNIQGGKQRSRGFEADLIFQPTPNWQIVTSLAHNNHHFTESAVAATIGQTYPNHVDTQYAVLSKYTFSSGSAKGLFVGLGAHGGTKILVDYVDFGTEKGVARFQDNPWYLEAFAGYRYKVFGYNTLIQLNVKNITGADDYAGWKATGSNTVLATERYKVDAPTVYRVTVGLDF
ncbi:MAG TPA: TonB-dependent receptor [Opitutaceae bacterium]|nr:TonB-dependent receptor [Opitutaceae bacterium]